MTRTLLGLTAAASLASIIGLVGAPAQAAPNPNYGCLHVATSDDAFFAPGQIAVWPMTIDAKGVLHPAANKPGNWAGDCVIIGKS